MSPQICPQISGQICPQIWGIPKFVPKFRDKFVPKFVPKKLGNIPHHMHLRFTLVYNPILALAFVTVYWSVGLFHAYSL